MAPEGELLKGPRWGGFDLCEGPKESGVGLLKAYSSIPLRLPRLQRIAIKCYLIETYEKRLTPSIGGGHAKRTDGQGLPESLHFDICSTCSVLRNNNTTS